MSLHTFSDAFEDGDLLLDGDQTDAGGDLAVTLDYDLEVVSGVAELALALKRRLLTPKGAISSVIQDVDGLQITGTEYGNDAYRYLSEPLNATTIALMRDAIKTCIGQESRVALVEIRTELLTETQLPSVVFHISYEIPSLKTTDMISLIRAGGALSAL